MGVRASLAACMYELWLALVMYLCQDTGEGEILILSLSKQWPKEFDASKDASLPDSK